MNLDLKTVLAEETGVFSHFLREGCDKGMKMQPEAGCLFSSFTSRLGKEEAATLDNGTIWLGIIGEWILGRDTEEGETKWAFRCSFSKSFEVLHRQSTVSIR